MTLIEIISLALAPLTGVVSWFASKRKHQAEVDSVIVKNSSEVIQQWKNLADRYEKELNEIRQRLDEVENELIREKNENAQLQILLKQKQA